MWEYKGHKCWIEQDIEDDCIKNWHYVITPAGVKKFAPLSPYVGQEALEAWIDAGCPNHPTHGNFYYLDGRLTP